MTISLIVAITKDRVMGNGPDIPWYLPADFEYFKKTTLGHPVIMGMKTHRSIGRILPGRKNIVLIAEDGFEPMEGAFKAKTINEAISLVSGEEVFIIGGGQVFRSTIGMADRLYITLVHGDFSGDIFFPEFSEDEWKEVSRTPREADEKNPFPLDWIIYERKK